MANGNGNSTHTILRWVIAIGVFLIVYFVAEDAMAWLLAVILGLIAGFIAYWLVGFLMGGDDASPAEASASEPAATSEPAAAPEPVAAPEPAPAPEPEPVAEAAPEPAEEPAPAPEAPADPEPETAPADPEPETAPAPAPKAEAPAAASDSPEVLDGPKGGVADDLKKIKGVGPGLEKTLNELGIYHFEQIAAWGPSDIEWVDARLKFKGRITRDDWVSQAKDMAK
jgi:predicted flap endonuclease-1-like 5' DNA nuclease